MESIMEEKYRIITVTELANRLEMKNLGESIDFTFDTTLDSEPSGWYGVKIVDLFNEPEGCIVMGYYGGVLLFQDVSIQEKKLLKNY